MREVVEAAKKGMPVLGICNGFQILTESGLLPGALTRNQDRRFICRVQPLKVCNAETAWTSRFNQGDIMTVILKSGEGRYVAEPDTLKMLEEEGRVVFRYADETLNGSANDIAGVCSENGRVVGLMPHPEHAIDTMTGPTTDGLIMFKSALDAVLSV